MSLPGSPRQFGGDAGDSDEVEECGMSQSVIVVQRTDALQQLIHNEIEDLSLRGDRANKGKIKLRKAQQLAEALQQNSSLKRLDLSYNKLGEKHALQPIAQALRNHSSLKKLFLRANGLKSADVECLVAELQHRKLPLDELDLSSNELDACCATALAALVSENLVKSLNVGWNEKLGNATASKLAAALPQTRLLQHLYLQCTGMTDTGIIEIALGLRGNSSLQKLHMLANTIGETGIRALQKTTNSNQTLEELEYDQPGAGVVPVELIEAIKADVRKNKKLSDLRRNLRHQQQQLHQLQLQHAHAHAHQHSPSRQQPQLPHSPRTPRWSLLLDDDDDGFGGAGSPDLMAVPLAAPVQLPDTRRLIQAVHWLAGGSAGNSDDDDDDGDDDDNSNGNGNSNDGDGGEVGHHRGDGGDRRHAESQGRRDVEARRHRLPSYQLDDSGDQFEDARSSLSPAFPSGGAAGIRAAVSPANRRRANSAASSATQLVTDADIQAAVVEVQGIRKAHREEVQALARRIEELVHAEAEAIARANAFDAERRELLADVTELEEESAELRELMAAHASLKDTHESLSRSHDEVRAQLARCQAEVQPLRADRDEHAEQAAEARRKCGLLEEQLTDARKTCQEQASRLEVLQEELADQRRVATSATERVASLEAELRAATVDLQQNADAASQRAADELETLTQRLASEQERVQQLEQGQQALRDQLQARQQELERQRRLVDETQAAERTARSDVTALQAALDAQVADLVRLQDHLDETQAALVQEQDVAAQLRMEVDATTAAPPPPAALEQRLNCLATLLPPEVLCRALNQVARRATPDDFEWADTAELSFDSFQLVGGRLGRRSEATGEFYGTGCAVYPVRCRLASIGQDRQFAAKVMYNYYGGAYARQQQAFRNEYYIPESLPPHRNLVRVHKHFRALLPSNPRLPDFPELVYSDYADRPTTVIISDLYDDTLAHCIDRMGFANVSERQILHWMIQILSSLEHLAANQCAHRDLKLDNIMVHDSGILGLIDFGTALDSRERPEGTAPLTVVYQHGLTLGGNIVSLPPECLDVRVGDVVDFSKTDVFGAGVVMYNMCGEAQPLAEDTKLSEYTDEYLPALDGMSEPLCLLARRMLRRQAEERPDLTTARQVCQALLYCPTARHSVHDEATAAEWLDRERGQAVYDVLQDNLPPVENRFARCIALDRAEFLVAATPAEVLDCLHALSQFES